VSPDFRTDPTPPFKGGGVTAVLGPTNTGKTYLAMDRMLGHASGMIGFPLRLLARENYDRVVRARGAGVVALITGEEKIIPPHPRYYICTVESMPLDREVAFLAVDEIQLAADADRGHVFTQRLLHARGTVETMFLGAETIKPLIRKLVPGAEFVTRPRFSKLTYTGAKKLTRLPRRCAVVAFSVSEVYGIAELIRRHRGGAAVVMGALSPRTRNAQVALYQSGDVDYMVATDAIGMGLNMDVDHVAFASMSKFDGRAPRALSASEVAQIAGRAGRHMNDGTFGVTAELPDIDPDIIARVEAHEFPPLQHLFWRNTDLRFTSLDAPAAGGRSAGSRGYDQGYGGARPRQQPGPYSLVVGCRPGAGLSQTKAGISREVDGPGLYASHARERRDAGRLDRRPSGAHQPHGRRHPRPHGPYRGDPDLDLSLSSRRLGHRCARMAGKDPRGGRPTFGRIARKTHEAVRR
jgi:hypothetical protein